MKTKTMNTKKLQGRIDHLGIKPGKPNCGIVSIALLIDEPVNQVSHLYRERFGMSLRWQGSTPCYERLALLKELGVTVNKIKPTSKTVMTWLKQEADPTKRYMVVTGDHVVTYYEGEVVDQSGIVTKQAMSSRARIESVWEVSL